MMRLKIMVIFFVIFLSLVKFHCYAGEVGVKDDEIIIGTTTSLTGRFSFWGRGINEIGSITYFKYINDKGGIHGRKIKNIIYDDHYNPKLASANAQTLLDKVFCLFAPFGKATNLTLMSIVTEQRIPLFSPITLSYSVVHPLRPYIFTLFHDYYTQASIIVKYVTSINKYRIAILYLDNEYGNEGLQGTIEALKRKDLRLLNAVSAKVRKTDLRKQIIQLRKVKPDAIILFTNAIQAALFIKQSQGKYKPKPLFIGPSTIATESFLKTAGKAAEGAILLSIIPDPNKSMKAGVIQYRELLKKYFPKQKPNDASLIGYTSAKVFVEGLQRVGKDLTRERFIEVLQKIEKYETGIIDTIKFTPKRHLGPKCPYFNRVIKGKFVEFQDCSGDG